MKAVWNHRRYLGGSLLLIALVAVYAAWRQQGAAERALEAAVRQEQERSEKWSRALTELAVEVGAAVADRGHRRDAAERAFLAFELPEATQADRAYARERSVRELVREALSADSVRRELPTAMRVQPPSQPIDVWLLGLLAAAAGGGAWLLRRNYQRPAEELAEVAEEVLAGKERRAQTARLGDLAALGTVFNRTVDGLAAARRRLEERVDEKTKALARSLKESQGLNTRLRTVLEELQATQDRLAQQEKMAALGTLARGIAHEFHNVLGGIRGCTEELLEDAVNPEDRETLEVIHRATVRGGEVVDRLKSMSLQESGPPVEIVVEELFQDTLRLLAKEAQDLGVQLAADARGVTVNAHPTGMAQILLNLGRNAIQASPPGGTVRFRAERVEGAVALSVEDEGAGIPPELQKRIFEPFFTTRGAAGGTGLGLAISHGIAERAGASLVVGRSPTGGAKFSLNLGGSARHDD